MFPHTPNHCLALVKKHPYETSAGNAFHIFSACKRVFTSACLFVFWDGFMVPVSSQTFILFSLQIFSSLLIGLNKQTNIKRNIGIVLIVLESAYAVALFVTLLLNGGEPS